MDLHSDAHDVDAPAGKPRVAAVRDGSGLLHTVDTNQNIIATGTGAPGAIALGQPGSDDVMQNSNGGSSSPIQSPETLNQTETETSSEVEPETDSEGSDSATPNANESNYLTYSEDFAGHRIYTIQSWPGCKGISLGSAAWYPTEYTSQTNPNPSEESLHEIYRSGANSESASEYELPSYANLEPSDANGDTNAFPTNEGERVQPHQRIEFPIWNLSQSPSLQLVGSFTEEQEQAAVASTCFASVAENNAARVSNSYPQLGPIEITDFALAYSFPSTSMLGAPFGDRNGEFDQVEEWYNNNNREQYDTEQAAEEEPALYPQYYEPDHEPDHRGNGEAVEIPSAEEAAEQSPSMEAVAGSIPETPPETYENLQPQAASVTQTNGTASDCETNPADTETYITRRVAPRRYQMRLQELVFHYGDLLTFYGDYGTEDDIQNAELTVEEISNPVTESENGANNVSTIENTNQFNQIESQNEEEPQSIDAETISPACRDDSEDNWSGNTGVPAVNEEPENSELPVQPGYIEIIYASDDHDQGQGCADDDQRNDSEFSVPELSELQQEFETLNVQEMIQRTRQLIQLIQPVTQQMNARIIQTLSSREAEGQMGEGQVQISVAGPSNQDQTAENQQADADAVQITPPIRTLSAMRQNIRAEMTLLRERLQEFINRPRATATESSSSDYSGGDADISSGTSSESSVPGPGSSTSTNTTENETTDAENDQTQSQSPPNAAQDTDKNANSDTDTGTLSENLTILRPRPPKGHRYTVSEFGMKGRRLALTSQPSWMPKYAHRLNYILSQYVARRETTGLTLDSTSFSILASRPEESGSSTSTSSSSSQGSDHGPRQGKKRKKHTFNIIRRAHFCRRGRIVKRRRISPNAAAASSTLRSAHPHPLADSNSISRPIPVGIGPLLEPPDVQKQRSCPELNAQRAQPKVDANNNASEPQAISLHRIRSEVLQGDGNQTARLATPRRGRARVLSPSPSVDSIVLSRRRIAVLAAARKKQRPFYVKILRFMICKKRSRSS